MVEAATYAQNKNQINLEYQRLQWFYSKQVHYWSNLIGNIMMALKCPKSMVRSEMPESELDSKTLGRKGDAEISKKKN